jgi:hypothetical protein
VSTGELDAQRPSGDQERALQFGTEFGLGTLERVSRTRTLAKHGAWGVLLGIIVVLGGVPLAAGLAAGSGTLAAKVVAAVTVGCLLAASGVLIRIGIARSSVSNRLFRYSGGLAQLVRGEPEPRVARWADVKDFTVTYAEPDEAPPRFSGFQVTAGTGPSLPGLPWYWRQRELRVLVAAADRNLAPRLVPAMTGVYESGGTVSFGQVQLSKEGITLTPWSRPAVFMPWSQVTSVHLTYLGRANRDFVHQVVIGRSGQPTQEMSLSHLPNGIFLPALLAHAAGQQGVPVTGRKIR